MTTGAKFCAVLLVVLIAVVAASHLPAFHQVHWATRVLVPEWGLLLLLPAIPAALWLLRSQAKLALLLLGLLLLLLAKAPFQAVQVASELSATWKDSWTRQPSRFPLLLGRSGAYNKVTEEYKPGLSWDRYVPESKPTARLLFVHGGSWRNGTREDFPQLLEYLAGRGYEVISMTYTLSGTAPFPAALQDIEAAIETAHGTDLPLFVAGRSSGGHLALLVSYLHPDQVKGVIAFYPPVDMVWSYQNPSNPAVLNSEEAIMQFMRATPEQDPSLYKAASPVDQVGPKGPPTLLIQGESDSLVYIRQSEMLSEKLSKNGVSHRLVALPWMEHGGDVFLHGPSGRISAWAVEAFIEGLR